MNVFYKNGEKTQFLLSDIDSIYFSSKNSPVATYEYVDLGLSVNWATFNVGATKPEEYGDYYAWGETEPKTNYSYSTYKWCNGSYNTLTKYCYDSNIGNEGFTDNLMVLTPEDDVAHVQWGGSWRIPTFAEWNKLRNNCTWTWYSSGNKEFNGVAGYKVTSKIEGYTDRFIFLPAVVSSNTEIYGDSSAGDYWSSSLEMDCSGAAWSIYFNPDGVYGHNSICYDGKIVRPVCPSEEWLSTVEISMIEKKKTVMVGSNIILAVIVKQNDEILDDSLVLWTSDTPSVVVVNEKGVVTAKSVGTAHITASIHNKSVQCTVIVIEESNIEPEYVDLGLSVKWATFNVGALSPEDFGAYYSWGETEPKTDYSWSTYKWCNGSDSIFTKYCDNSKYGNDGFTDTKTTLDPEDDVAHVKWGGSWRMPTGAEWNKLRNNCTWTWYSSGNTEFNGVAGYKVTSKIEGYTDRFIFLPAAGHREYAYFSGEGSYGLYWSSSYNTDAKIPCFAYTLSIGSNKVLLTPGGYRNNGYSVRPVCP